MAVQDIRNTIPDFHTGSIGDMQRLVVGTGDAVLPWVQEVANHDAAIVKDEVTRAQDELAKSLRYTGAPTSNLVSLLWHPLLGDKKVTSSEFPALFGDYAALRGRLLQASAAFAVEPSFFSAIAGLSGAVFGLGGIMGLFGLFWDNTKLGGVGASAVILGAAGLMGALKAANNDDSKRSQLKSLAIQFLDYLPESIKSEHFKTHLVSDPKRLVTGGYAQRYVREMIGEAEGMIVEYNEFIRDLELLKMRTGSRTDAVELLASVNDAQTFIAAENQVIDKITVYFQGMVQVLNILIAAFRSLPAAPQGENVTLPEIDAWCAAVLQMAERLKYARTRYEKSVQALQSLGVIAK